MSRNCGETLRVSKDRDGGRHFTQREQREQTFGNKRTQVCYGHTVIQRGGGLAGNTERLWLGPLCLVESWPVTDVE